MTLTAADIQVGRSYSAKRPQRYGMFPMLLGDRQVKYINPAFGDVQYDSPSVRTGRKYPTVTMEKFLKWAKEDVTSLMPPGDWREA